jgi:hypothetical protein
LTHREKPVANFALPHATCTALRFEREKDGNFKMRRFDFLKSRAMGGGSSSSSSFSDGAGFKRSGGFVMRKFNFLG